MYFLLRSTPLDLSVDRLRGLRLSLNTPVVSIDELPVEPARAAIAIHDEIDGSPNITVGVCSLGSGAVALFSFRGDLREQSALATAVDAALSFGESMGFLFDDDRLQPGSAKEDRSGALDLWLALVRPVSREPQVDPRSSEEPASPPSHPRLEEGSEDGPVGGEVLLLDEMDDSGHELFDLHAEDLADVDSEPPVLLSKFRYCASSPSPCPCDEEGQPVVDDSPPPAKGAALGQLKLVKRRQGRGQAPSKPSLIRRLLSSY